MAVVKVHYLRGRQAIKAHLRYITHRRVSREETITRPLFNEQGQTDKQRVYELIDWAPKGTIFYKIMINLDPSREDTRKDLDLQQITRHTIRMLEEKLGRNLSVAATIHNADHTPLRHVHGIFLLRGRLNREEFQALRRIAWATATEEARRQRRVNDLAYDRVRRLRRERQQLVQPFIGAAGGRARRTRGHRPGRTLCSDCLAPLTKGHRCEAQQRLHLEEEQERS